MMSLRTDLVLLIISFCIVFTQATRVFDAYRVLQYDRGTTPLGCRRTSLNSPATTLLEVPKPGEKAVNASSISSGDTLSFTRSVVLIKLADLLKSDKGNAILTLVNRDDITGVVVVLPEKSILNKDEKLLQAFQKLERALIVDEKPIEKPVYFTFENAELEAIRNHLVAEQNGEILPDTYQIVVEAADASLISSVQLTNIQVCLFVVFNNIRVFSVESQAIYQLSQLSLIMTH